MPPSRPTRQPKSLVLKPRIIADGSFSPLIFWIIAIALAAGVVAVYIPALDFQFILDDHHFVSDPRVQSAGHVWEYFTNYVWAQVSGGPASFYRPFFILWLRWNAIFSGMSPWGWHLLSIAKHLSVAVWLGWLVWKFLRDQIAALIAATLFALHPAQTESVAWVTVPDPLMSAAVLGSIILYLKYAEYSAANPKLNAAKSGRKSSKRLREDARVGASWIWLTASATACLIALLSKETAVVVPIIFFTLAITFGDPDQASTLEDQNLTLRVRLVRAYRKTLPFLAATAIYFVLRLYALDGRLGTRTQNLSLKTVLLSVPATLWFYVKVLLWPVRSYAFSDSSQRDTFSLSGVLWPGLAIGCAVIILALGLRWAWIKARHDLPHREAVNVERALLLGTVILLLPILLTLNLNALDPGDFLHGRYTYLPSAGMMLLLATAWHLSAKKSRTVLLIAAGLVAIAFAVLTIKQENMWKDDLTVFTVAHQIAPHNAPVALSLARAHVQVAIGLDEAGQCNQALPMFDEVIQQYPLDWYAWAGRGDCFLQLNDLPRAEQSLHRAVELSHEPHITQEWEQVRAKMGSIPPRPE